VTCLFLAPHCDDETLFAAYTLLRHQPHVVTCFAPWLQEKREGPDHDTRVWETKCALATLGVKQWDLLPVREDTPDYLMLEACLAELAQTKWEKVFAPAVELGGHEHHSAVGALAEQSFPNVTFYMTYVRGHTRSVGSREVPFDEKWPAAKFKAMSAYHSQINLADTRPWFTTDWDREWYE